MLPYHLLDQLGQDTVLQKKKYFNNLLLAPKLISPGALFSNYSLEFLSLNND